MAMLVSGRSHGYGSGGAAVHRVVVIVMHLGVCAIFDATVSLEFNCPPGHNGARTQCVGDAVWVGEGIQPERAIVNHLHNHVHWKPCEWYGVINAASALFESSNILLDFRDVIVVPGNV